MAAPTIHEYEALEMPGQKRVQVKMCKLRLHSSGVFSNVYRGLLLEPAPGREIAVKKTWPEGGKDAHKNYEVMMLLELSKEKHSNIVQALFTFKTVAPDGRVCESMIFDFMPSTLHAAIKSLGGKKPNIIDIKLYTWQMFNGLHYLYKKRICHRDIKPQNILIDGDQGILKLGDFGSAKVMKPGAESTAYQVTRFYRPPELLLDAVHYSPLVDVWSAGCVLGEMLRGQVLFPGRDSKHQLRLVIEALGSPDQAEEQAMRAFTHLEGTPVAPRGLHHLLPYCPRESIDFLMRILVYTPGKRLHGSPLLTDPYFSELFVPNKKRQNGRLVADIPSFKEMVDFGPKLHARRQKTKQPTKSAEKGAASQEKAVGSRQKSKESINKSVIALSRENTQISTMTTSTIASVDPKRGSREATVRPSKETLQTATKKK